MERLDKIKIQTINSKILSGNFGKGKYFGYGNKKLISLVEIRTNNEIIGFGESLVGIYSSDLYEKNLKYLSDFFLNQSPKQALKICQKLQTNKFFFDSGLLKSILASIEIGVLNLISSYYNENLATTINRIYFSSKKKESNTVKIYSSAGSIKSSLRNLREDIKKSKRLGIDLIKIRLDINKNYEKKIKTLKANKMKFSVDLICNTYEKNKNYYNLRKFLTYIHKFNPKWIEEALNVNDLHKFNEVKKIKPLSFSYGENFNSIFDYYNLAYYYKFKYINVDVSHITITDLIGLINLIEKKKLKTKIIFHCWGGIINLHTSLEIASLMKKNIEMVEFPIADFSLNNEFINSVNAKKSIIDLNSINRKNINQFYLKETKKKKLNKYSKYEFKFS